MASTPARALKTAARTVPARSRSKAAAAAAPQATHAPMAAREPLPRFSLDDRSVAGTQILVYHPTKGVDDFVQQLAVATPLQLVATERHGVAGACSKISRGAWRYRRRACSPSWVCPRPRPKKSAAGDVVSGSGGQAALGMARLLGMAQEMLAQSTAPEAEGFDSAKWLGQWLERPQPALGGRKPADLLDTPTGLKVVTRLLGAIHSGAYQ
ncbi:antitoxin Xre/MbcA/ParS toxin-binding domain-containing protein [Ideonella paludis]|uniref:antitoxin Xre/MbcA/ParS toxin-binding domain-containing protein n=1 Tax=Ideonella paludis TaxID=1233411 RepID=UPI003642BC47